MLRVQGLGVPFLGFPKLGVPFWGSHTNYSVSLPLFMETTSSGLREMRQGYGEGGCPPNKSPTELYEVDKYIKGLPRYIVRTVS